MKIIIDAAPLDLYKGWSRGGFHGGTEGYVMELARGLAGIGHTIHVITGDIQSDEQRGEREFWWPKDSHPTRADCVVCVHNLERLESVDYYAPLLVLATNGVDPYLGDLGGMVDAFPVFSETHAELLGKVSMVPRDKCLLTGLGIALDDYAAEYGSWTGRRLTYPENGRIFVSNDPHRGLWHTLDIFDELKKRVPEATLHVGYDFDSLFERVKWSASANAQMMWDCKRRMATTEGVKNLGALNRQDLIREQLECQVHVWPSDPPNVGSQIHGLTQMECAAAGAALVLSDIEALPEVFGSAAAILPVPGTYLPAAERRLEAYDWAEVVAELMRDPEKWSEASRKARELAEQHTWPAVIQHWEDMFAMLAGGYKQKVEAALATV